MDNEIFDSSVPHEEPSGGPNGDYMKRSDVERLMEDNIRTAVEVTTSRIVTGIVEETIEDAFTVGHDEQNEGIKKPVRNTMEISVIEIIDQGGLDTIPFWCTVWIN